MFGTNLFSYHFQIQLCPSSDFAVTQLHGILRLGFNSRSVDSKESHLFCACFNDNNVFFSQFGFTNPCFLLRTCLKSYCANFWLEDGTIFLLHIAKLASACLQECLYRK